ncbi:MAG TPA: nicotinate-nucleotide adenylyltransferase [Gemmatimonadaceae bacterium]|nr:nicotinate-nucleotide adenylyltransferase [Gemmatimonadaceae bacterium]
MRLGILGGTFDPPHVGHLLAAVDAFEATGLDRLIWVPAGLNPLKATVPPSDPAHRLAMVGLAVRGDARFAVDPVEIERAGLSYTVDTLRTLAGRWPGAELVLLVGADTLASFARWREPDEIRRLATLAILTRAGDEPAAALPAGALALETRRVDVSATEVRARVRAGRSIRGFVPDAVAEYIAAHRLYS